jgi:hypothetical protein
MAHQLHYTFIKQTPKRYCFICREEAFAGATHFPKHFKIATNAARLFMAVHYIGLKTLFRKEYFPQSRLRIFSLIGLKSF